MPAQSRFPVGNWGSYEILEYLGSGAMGSVYKAFDRQLERHVALKFLLSDNPSLVHRFQQEARAQARVEHENLCKIHEVGEVEGRHYIAMQFIDGERLTDAARKMSLAEKVLLMRDVAEGLHEAHRAGLIHRDIKPANIMVSRTDDGRWKPFVLDFGLAREAQAAGVTMTGAVVGTPSYMAPEQARGEIQKLDRRSDVYGLGATLYDMLTDRPPFEADTLHQVIPQVLEDVPRAPRDTHPEIPADIESIALKCLRKDPAERYDSARALADDLQRYLDGEPVLARPTNRWYRLRMKAKKNRVAVAVAAAALPVVLAAVGWAAWNQWTSARQQQLAQDFGQRVQRMESVARLSAMAPLHDIRPEQETIRTQMAAIEDAMRTVGKIARGPGQYALGRGDLALGNVGEARRHLEAAWAAGYRPPEVSYALGLVLGRQYQERLQDIATIAKEDEREEKRAAAQAELRDPALEQFRLAAAVETESPQYLEALMALYEDRHEEALSKAREAFDEHMWLYEAKRLEGSVLQLMGDDLRNRGEYEAAAERYAASVAALEKAAAVAPSDPLTYNRLAQVAVSRIALETQGRSRDPEPYFNDGLRATELAIEADPDNSTAYTNRAQIYQRIAGHRIDLGQDAGTDLEHAVEAGERAVQLDPGNAAAHSILGGTYREVGKNVRRRGEDPRPAFRKAIAAYETAGSLEPDWVFHANLGLLYKNIAVYQSGVGEDPRESFERSIQAYEHSLRLRPDFSTHYNLGIVRRELANYDSEHGVDPRELLSESASAFRDALALNPKHVLVLQALASVHNSLAIYELRIGLDPTADAGQALAALTTAIEENPESFYLAHLHDGRGIAYTTLLQHELSRGRDPSELQASAIGELEAAIAANPDYPYAQSNLCDLYRIVAEHESDLGRNPAASVRSAVQHGELALSGDPTNLFAQGTILGALKVLALHELETGASAGATISTMNRYADDMRSTNPNDPDTHRRRADLLVVEALRDAGSRGAFDALQLASKELREAIDLAPNRPELRLDRAILYDRWARLLQAEGKDADPEIAEGLASADAALATNSSLAPARVVRGSLLLTLASCGTHPHDVPQLLEDAHESIATALAANGHLARRCEPLLTRIDTLRREHRGT